MFWFARVPYLQFMQIGWNSLISHPKLNAFQMMKIFCFSFIWLHCVVTIYMRMRAGYGFLCNIEISMQMLYYVPCAYHILSFLMFIQVWCYFYIKSSWSLSKFKSWILVHRVRNWGSFWLCSEDGTGQNNWISWMKELLRILSWFWSVMVTSHVLRNAELRYY